MKIEDYKIKIIALDHNDKKDISMLEAAIKNYYKLFGILPSLKNQFVINENDPFILDGIWFNNYRKEIEFLLRT